MVAKDYRVIAWNSIKGKWGKLAVTELIYFAIMGACAGLSFIFVGWLAGLLLTGALTLGCAVISNKVIRGQSVEIETLFDGFKNYAGSLALHLLITIFTCLWTLLFIVPGIIKSLSYGLGFYILSDNPQMSANEARKLSMQMMRGNKWKLFCLNFSFIGWYLLSILTLGILSFWIAPYHNAAVAAFYQNLLPEENLTETENDV